MSTCSVQPSNTVQANDWISTCLQTSTQFNCTSGRCGLSQYSPSSHNQSSVPHFPHPSLEDAEKLFPLNLMRSSQFSLVLELLFFKKPLLQLFNILDSSVICFFK